MKNKTGFTLIEILVSITILSILLVSYFLTYQGLLKSSEYSQGVTAARTTCFNKMEEILSTQYGGIRAGFDGQVFNYAVGDVAGLGSVNFTIVGNVTIHNREDLYSGGENEVIDPALWPARQEACAVSYDNRIWIIGGRAGIPLNDVWSSTDGVNWTTNPGTTSANWSARADARAIVFDNKMWIIGGQDSAGNGLNDVWYSNDGTNWLQATDDAWFSGGKWGHAALSYSGKMWVLGGESGSGPLNEVWSSADGVNWTQETANAWDSGISFHEALIYDDKMWVIGGSPNRDDVFNSENGITWTVDSDNEWPGRIRFGSVVYDNRMWIMGGWNDTDYNLNDIWYSDDGNTWSHVEPPDVDWEPRYDLSVAIHNKRIWILGGDTGAGGSGLKNDVWNTTGYDKLLEVILSVSWRHEDGRQIGKDVDLDGILTDPDTEDLDDDGIIDSPVQLRVLVSTDKLPQLRRLFLGKGAAGL